MASIQPKAVMTKQILLLKHTQTKLVPHFGISLHREASSFTTPVPQDLHPTRHHRNSPMIQRAQQQQQQQH